MKYFSKMQTFRKVRTTPEGKIKLIENSSNTTPGTADILCPDQYIPKIPVLQFLNHFLIIFTHFLFITGRGIFS